MIEFTVVAEKCKEIQAFESEMLRKYTKTIYPYFSIFAKMGYELKVELGWYNFLDGTWSNKGLPLKNGYECCVYCIVEKAGEIVRIKSNDGEADYYELIKEWSISIVSRKFHKLKVCTFSDVDEVENDINELLTQLKNQQKRRKQRGRHRK